MNVNQRLDRIEQKLDLLLAATNVEANPGTTTDEGRTFAPGSGPIAEYKPTPPAERFDPAPLLAQAKAALHGTEPGQTGTTPGDTP